MEMLFTDLFRKIGKPEFLATYHDRRHYFEPGGVRRLDEIFSWDEFNDLVNRPGLWTGESIEMAIEGRVVPPAQYCRQSIDRYGRPALVPVQDRVAHFARQGATLVLDYVEGIAPGVQAVARCIERLTGAPTNCNVYCSWQAVRGYTSHFDTMDVFALQIAGEKTWNLYRGRVTEPAYLPGMLSGDIPQEVHDRQKGPVAEQVVMRPGDILYIPRGQYHDAIATDSQSLHISFGASYPVGYMAMQLLATELRKDVLFRKAFPHFETAEAFRAHLADLAEAAAAKLVSPEFEAALRRQNLDRLFERATSYALPEREPDPRFVVVRTPPRVVRRGPAWVIEAKPPVELEAAEGPLAEHVLGAEYVTLGRLRRQFRDTADRLPGLLAKLEQAGLVTRV